MCKVKISFLGLWKTFSEPALLAEAWAARGDFILTSVTHIHIQKGGGGRQGASLAAVCLAHTMFVSPLMALEQERYK